MHAVVTSSLVASLDPAVLARRLGELAGDERCIQADFLLHLEAFDRQRGYLHAGYSSLWDFCLKVLHLREGAAGRRIAAMRVLRRFPALERELRDGKLCLSTLGLLGPVLTEENLAQVVERAAFRTRAEVDLLVASMKARHAPKDGIRKLAGPRHVPEEGTLFEDPPDIDGARNGPAAQAQPLSSRASTSPVEQPIPPAQETPASSLPVSSATAPLSSVAVATREKPVPLRSRPELRPVSEGSYSLRLTLDAAFKRELDQLRQLLSHKVPSGDLAAILREAVRCAIEKHGKRRGAVSPTRKAGNRANTGAQPRVGASPVGAAAPLTGPDADVRASSVHAPTAAAAASTAGSGSAEPGRPSGGRQSPRSRPTIPAALRREVWARDDGQCAWRSEGGRRCESRWQLEFDHVVPVALGGPTTTANLRLACRAHNAFSAERVFGREHMERFRREAARRDESTIASGGER